MDDEVEQIKKQLRRKSKPTAPHTLSSGSTLINLAATGKLDSCWKAGHYYHFVGDSDSGKTWIALATLAEAARDPHFDNHHLIYDNGENGALMNLRKFFGDAMVDRLEPPAGTTEEPIYSATVEDLYYNLDDLFKEGEPFVYVQDSMDVLGTRDDAKTFAKQKSVRRSTKANQDEAKGSYGTAKSKLNSAHLRETINKLPKTGSILIIISQTRDRIGFGAQFDPSTVSGGRALKFYATLQLWSATKEKIKEQRAGKMRQLGIVSKVRVRKNRETGRDRTVYVPIYHSLGVDDIGSCVDYLLFEKHWKKDTGGVRARELELHLPQEELCQAIEEQGLEEELRLLTERVWTDIEDACKVKRKPRYD